MKLSKTSLIGVALFSMGSVSISSAVQLHMQRGWNLIGVPCQVNATTFLTPSMRNKIVVVWKAILNGDNVSWQAVSPNPQTQQWLTNHGFPRFHHINPYEGFWLYASQPFTLELCEPQVPQPPQPGQPGNGGNSGSSSNTLNLHGVVFGQPLGDDTGENITFTVRWNHRLCDLDTYIFYKRDNGRTGFVAYWHRHQDELTLDGDNTSCGGSERSHITPVRGDTLYIYAIDNFGSNEAPFYGNVQVTATDGEDTETLRPPQGQGREVWVVGIIDHGVARVCVRNCLFNSINDFRHWLNQVGIPSQYISGMRNVK